MVYMVIIGFLSVSVFYMIEQTELTKVEVLDQVETAAGENIASQFINSKTGLATEAVISGADDSCLQLRHTEYRDRSGLNFRLSNTRVTSPYQGILNDDSRSISFWLWNAPDQTTEQTILTWGNPSTAGQSVALKIAGNRMFTVDTDQFTASTPANAVLRDTWTHIVMVYDNSVTPLSDKLLIFVNGTKQTLSFDNASFIFNTRNTNTSHNLSLGQKRPGDSGTAFSGALGQLQLWNEALTDVEALSSYYGFAAVGTDDLQVHWPMLSIDTNVTPFIVNSGAGLSITGTAVNLDLAAPLIATTVEQAAGDTFVMADATPSDGEARYALYYRPDLLGCDGIDGSLSGWEAVTDAIYSADSRGFFFQASGDNSDPTAVRLRFSIDNARQIAGDARQPVTVTKQSALSQSFTSPDLCRVSDGFRFNVPAGVNNCDITQAFVYIGQGFESAKDRLYLPQANATINDNVTVYDSIPYVSNTVRASYNADNGVMRLYTTNNAALIPDVWSELLQQVAFSSSDTNYSQEKSIIFSLGNIPLRLGGKWHFYDFEAIGAGDDSNWFTVRTNAEQTGFCGTLGYLASVTSMTENEFIKDKIRREDGSFPEGWIGGVDNTAEGTWRWIGGPEHNQNFWSGGMGGSTLNGYFANFSSVANNPNPPYQNDDFLLYRFDGVWGDLPADGSGRISGYVLEWGGKVADNLDFLVFQETLDVSDHRALCDNN